MAEKLKDAADRRLEDLFRSDPVQDDGFSLRVVKRVRRQIWVRRLALPVAIVLGIAISAKPLMQLAAIVPQLVSAMPVRIGGIDATVLGELPQLSTVFSGLMLFAVVFMFSRMLED